MENNDKLKKDPGMTNRQAVGLLEAIKIIAEQSKTTDEVIAAINRIQERISEPDSDAE